MLHASLSMEWGAQPCALLNPGRLSGREDKMYSRRSQGVGATEVSCSSLAHIVLSGYAPWSQKRWDPGKVKQRPQQLSWLCLNTDMR